MTLLPDGFAELEPFVESWAAPDFQARFERRYEAAMPDVLDFYNAMLPRAEEALTALEGQPLASLEGEWLRLYQLTMALAHAAIAVERHGRPRAASATYPTSLQVIRGSIPD